jgi:hypothetical protein
MAVKFSDFTSTPLSSTGFIVGYDSSTNQNIRIPKSTLDSTYQSTLVSGTNIKTVNGTTLLGSGNVSTGFGGFSYTSYFTGFTPFPPSPGEAYVFYSEGDPYIMHISNTTQDGIGGMNFYFIDNNVGRNAIIITSGTGQTCIFTQIGSAVDNGTYCSISMAPFNIGTNPSSFSGQVCKWTFTQNPTLSTINSTSLYSGGNITVQPTLVSGTNIKTINSTSLLGSGNVSVQSTLVSGTNIKTINSNSLLGSGDLVVGGPGSGSAHMVYGTTNLQYSNTINASSLAFGSLATASGAVGLTPFTPRVTFQTGAFSVLVTVAGGTTGGGIVIYTNPTGSQAASGITITKAQQYTLNLTAGTTGIYTVNAGFTFQAGTTYWIGFFSNINASSPYTLATYDPKSMLPISSPIGAIQYVGHYITGLGTSSTLPNTFSLSSATISNTITQVWFTVA